MIQSGDDDWIIIPIPSGIELRTLYGILDRPKCVFERTQGFLFGRYPFDFAQGLEPVERLSAK